MSRADFTKKPPEQYIEGYVKYVPGLDTRPELIDFWMHGYTFREAQRMCDLFSIEAMKYYFEEAREDGEATEEELKEFESYIEERIARYNESGLL